MVSACSIFKKTNKVKEEFKTSVELEAAESKQITANTQTSSGSVEDLSIKDRSTSSKSIRADRIRLLPDGSLEAYGNAEYNGFDQNDLDSIKRKEAFESSNSAYYEDAKSRLEYESSSKQVVKTAESKTDGVGVIFGAVALLVVISGWFWWLGVKKR